MSSGTLLVKDTFSATSWRVKGVVGTTQINTTVNPDSPADPTFGGIVSVTDGNPTWLDEDGDPYTPRSYRDVLREGGYQYKAFGTTCVIKVQSQDNNQAGQPASALPPPLPPPPIPASPPSLIQCSLQRLGSSSSPQLSLVIQASPWANQQQGGGGGGSSRRRIMFFLLDRSGSMSSDWGSVVDGVVSVLTPEIVSDPAVTIHIVAYAVEAVEVPMPTKLSDLWYVLKGFTPGGRTVFRSAFDQVRRLLSADISKLGPLDPPPQVSILFFTDGCDTSIQTKAGIDEALSADSARKHFDELRVFLKSTKCDVTTYVAAYTKYHNPELCGYFGDKYKYIDRQETLTQALFTSMSEMVTSTGTCALTVTTPPFITAMEPCPGKLPLDSNGTLSYDMWFLVSDMKKWDGSAAFFVEVSCLGCEVVRCTIRCSDVVELKPNTFDFYMFLIRQAKVEVRRIAAHLSDSGTVKGGRRKLVIDTAYLEGQLRSLRTNIESTRAAACMPFHKKGAIDNLRAAMSSRLSGRDVLFSGLEELDAMMDRLSFVAWQNVQGKMTDVQSIAILNEARQHLPQTVRRRLDVVGLGNALRIENRQKKQMDVKEAPPIALSAYGVDVTKDAYSCCDAHDVAVDYDAMFFTVSDFQIDNTTNITKFEDGIDHISFQAFRYLKEAGMKQNMSTQYSVPGVGVPFTSVWMPMYCSEYHFNQAVALLPDALGHLFYGDPLSFDPTMYDALFEMFGRSYGSAAASIASSRSGIPTEASITSLLLKSRAMDALCNTQLPTLNPSEPYVPYAARIQKSGGKATWVAPHCSNPWQGIGLLMVPSCATNLAHQVPIREAMMKVIGDVFFHACNGVRKDNNTFKEVELLVGASRAKAYNESQLFTTILNKAISLFPSLTSITQLVNLLESFEFVIATKGKGYSQVFQAMDAVMLQGTTTQFQLPTFIPALSESIKAHYMTLASSEEAAIDINDLCVAYIIRYVLENIGSYTSLTVLEARDIIRTAEQRIAECKEKERKINELRRAKRVELCRKHPIPGYDKISSAQCICGAHYSESHAREVWGGEATPDDAALYRDARIAVLNSRLFFWSSSKIDAMTEKEYQKRGGTYTFGPEGDTFLRGLHIRVKDYFGELKGGHNTVPFDVVFAEVSTLLRWDRRVPGAEEKLKLIVNVLWSNLCGKRSSDLPNVSSTLWDA